jgi:DtxR family transcriptional regulator, Mn-dependent transcriptional regulator
MNREDLTSAMEDYLKQIYHLQDTEGTVGSAALAARLHVSAPSVTNMVKRLHDVGLVSHSPYRGIDLTPVGRTLALEVIRHHRLIELYLAEFLGMPWDKVHDEAERLEHVISEDLESRMAEKLGQPGFDPHGDPIPTSEGTVPDVPSRPLWEAPIGERVTVARVSDRDPGLLAFLADIGLIPGSTVFVTDVSPYAGTQTVRIGETEHVVGADLARSIRVRPVAPARSIRVRPVAQASRVRV